LKFKNVVSIARRNNFELKFKNVVSIARTFVKFL